jgi:hypothetical protein
LPLTSSGMPTTVPLPADVVGEIGKRNYPAHGFFMNKGMHYDVLRDARRLEMIQTLIATGFLPRTRVESRAARSEGGQRRGSAVQRTQQAKSIGLSLRVRGCWGTRLQTASGARLGVGLTEA